MNTAQLTLENHYRFTGHIVDSAKDLLLEAKENGTLADWNRALETCIRVQDFAGRELLRYRVRKQLLECCSVVNGEFDGMEEVELGSWADNHEDSEIPNRAQELIELHRNLYA